MCFAIKEIDNLKITSGQLINLYNHFIIPLMPFV